MDRLQFLEDLNTLLERHNANIETEAYKGAYGLSANITITFDNSQDIISFGHYIDPDKVDEIIREE